MILKGPSSFHEVDIHEVPSGGRYSVTLSTGQTASFCADDLKRAVILIFKGRFDGRPVEQVVLLGSGFFVAPLGIFVTAKHVVINDINAVCTGDLSCAFIDQSTSTLKSFTITEMATAQDYDIAVGVVDLAGQEILCCRLTDFAPGIGEDVLTFGFSDMRTEVIASDHVQVFLNPQVYKGTVTQLALTERVSALVCPPVYLHSVKLGSGISGGPLFAPFRNRVIAVISASFELQDGEGPIGFSTPIGMVLDMPLPFLGGSSLRARRDELRIDLL